MTTTSLNGAMPADLLKYVDVGPNGPQQLAASVAPIWTAMLAAGMPLACLRSGYRDLAQQADEVAAAAAGKTPSALPPGQSKHGLGLAADIDEPARTWAHAHAATYGLVFPVANEPWHCELDHAHLPARPTLPATPAPAPQEDDMLQLIQWCYATLVGRGPSIDETLAWLHAAAGKTSGQVVDLFLGAKAEPGAIAKAYTDYLGRGPSAADIAAWTGNTIGAVRAGVAGSPEAKTRG